MAIAGLGEFNFRGGNSRPTVIHDVLSALAAALSSSTFVASTRSKRD
jgi:hypothetical protein